ncbi:FAD-dependent oxidoreductase [Sutterella sp.]|uniref:FAD-dependent oxidoreductase n=1 Tax=Sutterella sp. TaxID=1981025 RepID=UPI0026E035CD|nr:FAD-dependent oxidoreductase [Sutterella sp.]MDO5531559.1 FAD-dependent oxidoreductase [Sutterella sp.]
MAKIKMLAVAVAATMALPAWADRNLTADLVIVGAGAGGTTAAARAVEGGLKTIMLEKNAFAGGAGNFMEGSFAAESFLQKEKGINLTKTEAFNRMAAYHHWRVNAPLMKAFVDKTAYMVKWVNDHGVHWKEVKTAWRDNDILTWHIYPGAGSLPKRMVEIFKSKGGELLLSTPAEKLIVEQGRVVGVEARDKAGEKVTVRAKNVILATGGYNFNVDMVKEMTGIDMIPVGAPGRTGDGINMALAVGAVGDNMGPMMINGAFMPAEGEAICNGANKELRAMFRMGLLYVDSTGNRFFNEELTIDWPTASNAIARTGEWTYIVFDQATIDEFSTKGKGYPNPCGNFIQRHQAATMLPQLLAENEKKGNVFVGNTIEEVAKKAGMDPAILRASCDAMTKYAKQGKDEQFGKDPYYLRAIDKGPFYVVRGKLNTLTSLNGVKVNANLQVLDKNEHVIPGLYALGHDAGGMYGDSYDLKVGEGTASSFAVTGGLMAVEHILSAK